MKRERELPSHGVFSSFLFRSSSNSALAYKLRTTSGPSSTKALYSEILLELGSTNSTPAQNHPLFSPAEIQQLLAELGRNPPPPPGTDNHHASHHRGATAPAGSAYEMTTPTRRRHHDTTVSAAPADDPGTLGSDAAPPTFTGRRSPDHLSPNHFAPLPRP